MKSLKKAFFSLTLPNKKKICSKQKSPVFVQDFMFTAHKAVHFIAVLHREDIHTIPCLRKQNSTCTFLSLFRHFHNYKLQKMCLLVLPVCLSTHLAACNNLRINEQIFIKFDTGEFTKICQHIPILVETTLTGTLHKTYMCFCAWKWGIQAGEFPGHSQRSNFGAHTRIVMLCIHHLTLFEEGREEARFGIYMTDTEVVKFPTLVILKLFSMLESAK
jgi:hypothetical protein